MKFTSYFLLMLLLSPVLTIGLLFYMIPILLTRGTVSGTAYEPFNGRLVYHLMGSRPDPMAWKLAAGLPATNWFTLALMVKPIAWASRITGYLPVMIAYPPPRPTKISGMVGARCEFFDGAMPEHISAGDQVVVLGAGWDTRAYGLLKGKELAIFEVDAPATQAVKRAALEATGIDSSQVTFVACDFNRQSWLDALKQNGFSTDRRTFILWEGVTMYLEAAAITETLRAFATLPPDSRIACDFFSQEWLEETRAGKMARRGVRATYGECFSFGFPVKPELRTCLNAFLEPHDLCLESARPLGDETPNGLPFGGLLLAKRRSDTNS